jgi:hypothetical protein
MTCLEILVLVKVPWVISRAFPDSAMLIEVEWRRSIQESGTVNKMPYGKIDPYTPIKADQIAHCANCEVNHNVHVMGMDCIDGILPISQGAPVWIEYRKVEGRIT